MDAIGMPDTLLVCERCGHEANRSLAEGPDPFCHACGELMRIVDLLTGPLECEGRRRRLRSLVRP